MYCTGHAADTQPRSLAFKALTRLLSPEAFAEEEGR